MEMWFDHVGADERGVLRKRKPKSQEEGAEENPINLTPMLDVVMIMLIFFIVTGSFVREWAVEVERKPTSDVESNQPSGNIVVRIATDDSIWIRDRRIDVSAVRANLLRLKAGNPKTAVIIKANNKSRLKPVVAVTDAAREAGIYAVSLTTGD